MGRKPQAMRLSQAFTEVERMLKHGPLPEGFDPVRFMRTGDRQGVPAASLPDAPQKDPHSSD